MSEPHTEPEPNEHQAPTVLPNSKPVEHSASQDKPAVKQIEKTFP
jgi:hypothetical protein